MKQDKGKKLDAKLTVFDIFEKNGRKRFSNSWPILNLYVGVPTLKHHLSFITVAHRYVLLDSFSHNS